jgi:hypothetical protein
LFTFISDDAPSWVPLLLVFGAATWGLVIVQDAALVVLERSHIVPTPSDMAVVQEGFVAHCPASKRANDQTNAWFIKKPGPTEVLCKGFMTVNGGEVVGVPVPAGYVVTAETKATVCAKSRNAAVTANAWEIRLPRQNEVVCKGFPLPQGFVVVDERSTPSCPSTRRGKNAWVIKGRD